MSVQWNHANFAKSQRKKALDGIEECARVVMLTEAKENCPVKEGVMRGSLMVERDDNNECCYLGGGGPAKAYIYRQEKDKSLNHTVGKAGFIEDSVDAHVSELNSFVQKHINQ